MRRHCRDTPRQTIYLDDPVAANPSRLSQNRTSLRLRTRSTPTLAVAWMPAQPTSHWRRLLFADDSKRKFRADYLTRQVWVWNGHSPAATPSTFWYAEQLTARRSGSAWPTPNLTCGILAHGFARGRCAECDQDFLVAYSCKGRGICPSCNTRRMVETAAHLADHVIPPPRKHRHRYVGVLAPNSPLRAAVTTLAQSAGIGSTPVAAGSGVHTGPIAPLAASTDEPLHRKVARYAWALVLARICEVLPLGCPKCGGQMKIIAFITEAVVIQEILGHLGEPTSLPRLLPVRGPPQWEIAGVAPHESDPQVQPAPHHAAKQIPWRGEFDQRIAW